MLDHNNFYFIMSHQSFEEWKNNYDRVWETIDDYSERSDAEIIHDVKQIIFERPEDEREFLNTVIRGVHDMNNCVTMRLSRSDVEHYAEMCINRGLKNDKDIAECVLTEIGNNVDYVEMGEFHSWHEFIDAIINVVHENK